MSLKDGFKDNWKNIVRNVAPALGTALGGPMAGTAIKVIADGLLGDDQATEQDVAEYIASASPEQLVKLREIDSSFKLEMKRLDIDLEKIAYKDRDSARELAKYNMWPQIVLSAIYTVGYVYILSSFLSGDVSVPANVKTEFNLVLGVLTVGMTNIMQFWFGSSAGSKQKPSVITST